MPPTPPLYTPVSTSPSALRISHECPILLLGSCFADEVGTRLATAGFDILCNPFGTLYNPLSIASCLLRARNNEPIDDSLLFFRDGLWHSWLHHTRFSHPDRSIALQQCNNAITQTHRFLARSPLIFITFGTAYIFRLAEPHPLAGSVVANCHKMPASTFLRERLSVQDIIEAWHPILQKSTNHQISNPSQYLFTVSPIRHLADGAHGNQLSKSTLLLAVDSLLASAPPEQANYFDSYEILLDELRDYRFYARDLCHPSDVAVDIVWHHFQQSFMSAETQERCRQFQLQSRKLQHHPISQLIE